MKAEDYIKEGDGNRILINRAGRGLVARFVTVSGGLDPAAEISGLHPNTISKVKNFGSCAPETWQTLFDAMTNQHAA